MLELKDIDVFYGKSQALHNINISINEGEFVTIIGANGAGKTTIMKTIIGLLKPKNGSIIYKGEDITHKESWTRSQMGIGYVPEGRRVFPELTVEENLRMGCYNIKDNAKIKENYDLVYELFPRLKERKTQLAKTMSGGEQQMLAIGRALMSSPKLLLIDEISMGLMPILINASLNVLKQLNEKGLTILLVEQNAKKALSYAERGYVLQTGRIILSDTTESLLSNEQVKKAYLGG
ncbi:MAG: ABC transporter ATP-binding protein [Thermoanaerobacteraceae bacterium]|nr:ABC transporter ATP-binding protein [Thermoanaerobacteraceae bacterium]